MILFNLFNLTFLSSRSRFNSENIIKLCLFQSLIPKFTKMSYYRNVSKSYEASILMLNPQVFRFGNTNLGTTLSFEQISMIEAI